MGLSAEIHEQPAVIRAFLQRPRDPISRIAETLRSSAVDGVTIAARGTSDHAAIYAQYVLGVRHRLPVGLAAPSIVSLYGVELRVERTAVIGISQSGASPDVVAVVAAARRQGAPTIAITNTPDSPLGRTAEQVIDLGAGAEHAVAATKTYTAELVAIALLSAILGGDSADLAALDGLPDAVATALGTADEAAHLAEQRAGIAGCVVLGRGFEYATAREWALKLKELARLLADPYSAADFQHGPLALLEPGFPVLAVAPSGAAAPGLVELLVRLRDDHRVDLVVISDRDDALAVGAGRLPIPRGLPDWLMPIVSIVPAQLFAYQLARARGLDPDSPRHIRKVTLTR